MSEDQQNLIEDDESNPDALESQSQTTAEPPAPGGVINEASEYSGVHMVTEKASADVIDMGHAAIAVVKTPKGVYSTLGVFTTTDGAISRVLEYFKKVR